MTQKSAFQAFPTVSTAWLFQAGLLHVVAYRDDKKHCSHLCVLLLCAHLLHLLQDLLSLINIAFCAELFGLGQELSDFFVQLMDFLCLKFSAKNLRYFVSSETRGTRMKAWCQLTAPQMWLILTCKLMLQNERKKAWSLTFAATSALISSWVSARRFLASSVLRSHSAMNDSRWSTAFRRKKQTQTKDAFLSAHLKPLILAAGGDHVHRAQRTALSPSRRFHSLPEVPGHES